MTEALTPLDPLAVVRHLIDCYEAVTFERPSAVYITKVEKEAILQVLGDGLWFNEPVSPDLNEFFGCRIELHEGGHISALTRDERGLTKVIICPFCAYGMVSHTPRDLLGLGAPPEQYECSNCYIVWPTDRSIIEATERAVRILKESIKKAVQG